MNVTWPSIFLFPTTPAPLFSTTTPAPLFPEKYESLSIYNIYMKVREFAGHFNIAAFIIKVPIFIFFTYHIIKRTKNICNVYFCLLMIGFFWDILDAMIYSVFLMTCTSDEQCPILMRANKLSFWYNTDLSGIWTLALTINRLTAIVWWQKYEELWSKNFKYCFALLSIYPFLLHGYSFFDYSCRLELDDCKNYEAYWLEDAQVTSISSIIIAVISFFTDMVTVTIYRIKIKKDNALKKNPDKKLIYQAVISSFLFVLYTAIFQYWAILRDIVNSNTKINKIGVVYTIAYGGMHYSYIASHGSAFILIFFISPNLRKNLIKFYHLTWIYKMFPSTKSLFPTTTAKSTTNTKSVSTANTLTPVTG